MVEQREYLIRVLNKAYIFNVYFTQNKELENKKKEKTKINKKKKLRKRKIEERGEREIKTILNTK